MLMALPAHEQGEDDDLLLRADKSPNRRGLENLLTARDAESASVADLLDRAVAGELSALLVVGEDLATLVSEEKLAAATAAGLELIVVASHENATTRAGTIVLPTGIFPEVDGTVVNFQGRVQVMRAAYPPPFLARTGAWILTRLASRLGDGSEDARPRDLFDELAAQVPAFQGLTFARLGAGGCVLPGGACETPASGSVG